MAVNIWLIQFTLTARAIYSIIHLSINTRKWWKSAGIPCWIIQASLWTSTPYMYKTCRNQRKPEGDPRVSVKFRAVGNCSYIQQILYQNLVISFPWQNRYTLILKRYTKSVTWLACEETLTGTDAENRRFGYFSPPLSFIKDLRYVSRDYLNPRTTTSSTLVQTLVAVIVRQELVWLQSPLTLVDICQSTRAH